MALELLIDAVDRIALLQAGSMFVTQTREGFNSICTFTLFDEDVFVRDAWTVEHTHVETDGDRITTYVDWGNKPKVEVKVCDGATTYFAGILVRMTLTHMGKEAHVIHCECYDFTQVLEESVVDTLETYLNDDDEDIIDDIFTNYVTGINFADFVATVGTIDEANFDGITVRKVLDILAAQTGAVWYVDYDKKLHYNAAGADAPAWHLSDNPDDINSFSYFDDISRERCVINLINMVFVIGEAASTWYEDAASRAEWGNHRVIYRDQNLVETADMEAVATNILDKCKNPIDTYTLSTYKDGLRAGMKVRIVCALFDVDGTFLIDSLIISFPPDKDPVYRITCGGTTSSPAATAHRLSFDDAQDWRAYQPADTVLSSLGWAHDLGFSSADVDTVAWTLGQIIAANGTTLNIVAGNTGNMGAGVYYVYLDTAISATILQTTQVMASTVGANRIPVAVCWASDGVGAETAGFMVFKGGDEQPLILCATNIGADVIRTIHLGAECVTATQIGTITLDVATKIVTGPAGGTRIEIKDVGIVGYSAADVWQFALDAATGFIKSGAGAVVLDANGITVTGGMFSLKTDVAGNDRIEITSTKIAGYDAANTLQFELSAANGKAYFGAGAGIMDEDGLRFLGAGATGDTRRIRFMYDDAGTERRMGRVFSDWGGGAAECYTWLQAWRQVGAPWGGPVRCVVAAIDNITGKDVRLEVLSTEVVQTAVDVRIGKGLHVGDATLGTAPTDNDIKCNGTIATNSAEEWNLGGTAVGTITPDRKIHVEINGAWYTIAAQVGLV